MQVNLRKANALAKSLQDEALKQSAEHAVAFSIYDTAPDFAGKVDAAAQAMRTALEDALALTEAAYAVRALMGKAFHTSGINDVLTRKALLDRKEKLLTQVFAYAPAASASDEVVLAPRRFEALLAQHEAAKTAGVRAAAADSVSVRVPRSAYDGLEDALRDIRREKAEIADELLGLNAGHRITLPEAVVTLVERFKLN
ncbi:hypothetical protein PAPPERLAPAPP_03690 [Brevundimonas phage vB_BpoS-Papperlapapp]|uniref:Uncharacterized protein n=1 Tax=Brevundimonas phage vB_BpoS-Domovoi TaxID=2948598 RepID=A0A9E7SJR6_9CAUD|nr:hypothetical protein DOMOVOI_02640 [Brevundimonas phage vB_BpoS-Domovoi]USN16110.1 hypothetical protein PAPPERLAPAPP_03690 [Brevundimonas phage vB_BpoS-Papperlapapp]